MVGVNETLYVKLLATYMYTTNLVVDTSSQERGLSSGMFPGGLDEPSQL